MSASFPCLAGRRTLVTGGTGFVGRHALPLLVEAGAKVTCLARPSSDVSRLPAGVAVARADLATGQGLDAALDGQDICIHMAALLFGLRWQDYLRANGAAASALAASVTRLRGAGRLPADFRCVLVSSQAASGPCATPPGVPDDVRPAPVSAYGWSKLLAEHILGRALGDALVTLRPSIVYGSGDKGLLPVFRGVRRGLAVSPGWGREFPVSVIHADDMARAICHACAPEARGVYHACDGGTHTMRSFCEAMGAAVAEACGAPARPVRVIHMPLPVMAATAGAATAGGMLWDGLRRRIVGRGIGRPPEWNLDKYREARQAGWLCDGGRLRRELGFVPRISVADGLREAARGYRAEGWL